jgi:phage-related protein
MDSFTVEMYEKANGERPVEEFLNSLDSKMQSKLIGLMGVLEEKGNDLREPFSKYLEEGIFELRCKQGNNITRVLYFFYVGRKIILTNGYVKKTQKTPKKIIELSKSYRKDYLERKANNENL